MESSKANLDERTPSGEPNLSLLRKIRAWLALWRKNRGIPRWARSSDRQSTDHQQTEEEQQRSSTSSGDLPSTCRLCCRWWRRRRQSRADTWDQPGGGPVVVSDAPRRGTKAHTSRSIVASPSKERSLGEEALHIAFRRMQLGQPWYVPIREMQLASVDMCVAVRRRSKWKVHVTSETPKRLWLRRERDRYRRRDVALRIPLMRVSALKWDAPVEIISKGSALFDMPPSKQDEVQRVDTEWWPRATREITFGNEFNDSVDGIVWPDVLHAVTFGRRFNRTVDKVAWPPRLSSLTFGSYFNQPIEKVSWPDSLQCLEFGTCFNQPIEGVSWPASLRGVSFGAQFNQSITGVVWPQSLRCIKFGWDFNVDISRVEWPPRLESISFAGRFNQKIDSLAWPASLQSVKVGRAFRQPIARIQRSGVRVEKGRHGAVLRTCE